MEMDERFIMAADSLSSNLLLFNRHLRICYKVNIPGMIPNFPYIKIKSGTIAFVSNLEDMKYHFLGRSNAFTIFR